MNNKTDGEVSKSFDTLDRPEGKIHAQNNEKPLAQRVPPVVSGSRTYDIIGDSDGNNELQKSFPQKTLPTNDTDDTGIEEFPLGIDLDDDNLPRPE